MKTSIIFLLLLSICATFTAGKVPSKQTNISNYMMYHNGSSSGYFEGGGVTNQLSGRVGGGHLEKEDKRGKNRR